MTHDLGLQVVAETESNRRLVTAGPVKHEILLPTEPLRPGRWGVGTVHHIAWSVPNEESQINWQDDLYTKGYGVTEIKDRNYFKAVYFKEPGTILLRLQRNLRDFSSMNHWKPWGQHSNCPSL